MKRNPRIVGIGIAVVDIYRHHGKMYPGGNEYNVAYHAKLQGADAAFMGVFADDRAGKLLEEILQEAGIDTSQSHHEKGSSGYAIVDLVRGDRVFVDWNRQGVTDLYPFSFTEEEIEYIKTFDIASLSKNSRVTYEKFERLAEAGVAMSYDFNDNFTEEDIKRIAPCVKIGFFSSSHLEEEEIKGLLKRCVDLGCEIAVGTRGEKASIAYDGRNYYYHDIVRVKARDTMGAGDSFISAFLTNYLSAGADESFTAEDKISDLLRKAAEYAAGVVVRDGALGIGYDVDPDRLSEVINI